MNALKIRIHFGNALAGCLFLLLACFALSRPVLADVTGQCGDQVSYRLDDDGNLTISGTGDTWDFTSPDGTNPSPFSQLGNIRHVYVNSGVTRIGNYFLFDIGSVQDVRLPYGLRKIGMGAFSYTGLTNLVLRSGLEDVGPYAFEGCRSMTGVYIPETVANLGSRVFFDCKSLTWITVSEGNTVYREQDGVLFDRSLEKLLCFPAGRSGSYEIPSGTKEIASNAFYGVENLRSVSIPESVHTLGVGSFSRSGLVSAVIPDSVQQIPEHCFSMCFSLERVLFGKNVTSIGKYAFWGDDALPMVILPEGVYTVEDRAFGYCPGLQAVYLPDSAEDINFACFNDSSAVALYGWNRDGSGTLAETVASMLDLPFHEGGPCGEHLLWTIDAYGEVTIFGDGPMTDYSLYDYSPFYYLRDRIRSAWMEPGVTTVGSQAFLGCEYLMKTDIPYGVTDIGPGAFASCLSLERAAIPGSVASIGARAFASCASLKRMTFPWRGDVALDPLFLLGSEDTVLFLYSGTSQHAWALEYGQPYGLYDPIDPADLVLPAGLTEIEEEAFAGCTAEVIYLPDTIQVIGKRAFADCPNLRQILICSGTVSIADDAFAGCPAGMVLYTNWDTAPYAYALAHGIIIGEKGFG